MRTFSNGFRNALKGIRELSAIVTYKTSDVTYILTTELEEKIQTESTNKYLCTESGMANIHEESINSVNPIIDTTFLKSVCNGVKIDSKVDIPINNKINVKIGCLVNNNFEYIDFGNYIITKSIYQANTESYLLEAYDSMVKTNVSYDDNPLGFQFPMTIRDLISRICNKFEIRYKLTDNGSLDKVIEKDLWKDLGLNYRDILDDISATTGNLMINIFGTMINKNPNSANTNESITDEELSTNFVDIGKTVIFNRLKITDNNLTILNEYVNQESITTNGEFAFQINDNLLLSAYPETLGIYAWNMLNNLQYTVCDISTIGILIFEALDKFNIVHNNETYVTILLQDDVQLKEGLKERIISDNISTTDSYKVVNKYNNKLNKASISINKANGEIILKVDNDGRMVECKLGQDISEGSTFEVKADNISLEGYTTINNGFTIDEDGNMTCNDANINGNLVTANGVYTNLLFNAEGWGWNHYNAYDETNFNFVGWNLNENQDGIQQSFLNIPITIPNNFVVTSAKIYIKHSPMRWASWYSSTETPGSCKNIRLYKVNNLGQSGHGYYNGYVVVGGNNLNFGNPINNDSFTFSNSQYQEVQTSDIKDIFNEPGTYNIVLKSSDTKASSQAVIDNPDVYLGADTGILYAYAEVLGYISNRS